MPLTPWTRRGVPSSSARGARPGGSCGASAGSCCEAGRNLDRDDRRSLRELFTLNRRLAKAYLLQEQLAQLWTYTYEGRLAASWPRGSVPCGGSGCRRSRVGRLLTRHLEDILNCCHEKVPFGKVEAINGNIRAMLRRGRGYRDHEYLLLKVQPATATRRRQAA